MKIEATFVRSAASAEDFPRDGAPEIALVGRSNVGKSSLINALVRQKLARTSAAPGKTRLANIYRVTRGACAPVYLVDLPGYGYARGDRAELDTVARAYFGRVGRVDLAALFLVDARHPGLANDVTAWNWLTSTVAATALAATKIDKLSRVERLRATERIEAVFHHPATAVSAETGEGLEDLWKLIDRLTNPNSSSPRPPRQRNRPSPPPRNPTAAAATDSRLRRHRRPRS